MKHFFRYHGIWAPGVRLFRVMTFAGKASLIALAFLVPVVVLGALFVPAKLETIRQTVRERTGLGYANEAVLLLRRAQDYRALALQEASGSQGGDVAAARRALDAQVERVALEDARVGAALGTSPELARARTQLAAVAGPKDGLMRVYATQAKFIESIYALVARAADGGGLTLDPELEASSLVTVGAMKLPRMIDEASRMGSLAAAVAAMGSGREIAGVELNRLDTLVEERGREAAQSLAKVVAADASTQPRLDTKGSMDAIDALRDASTDAPGTGGRAKADQLMALGTRALASAWASQQDVMAMLEARLAAREQRAWAALRVVSAAVLTSLGLAAYMLYAFFLVVNGGLTETRRHLDRMAEGDLTSAPTPWGRDDAADLMVSLMRMQGAVREIVAGVRDSAERIASSSAQIAEGVGDISTRAESTAASLQQSSSAMTAVSSTLASTDDSAREAVDLARRSASAAGEGGVIVRDMVGKMNAIDTSSRRIGDIIGVIEGIAFQTNILALNAAVEAARAGDQGRGFAVVAAEVRSLALRASTAAKEIKGLIGESVENVRAGTRAVHVAGETMTRIVGQADRVSVLLGEVSSGAQRQRERVGELTTSVARIDDATQQNAALSEQAAAATSDLNEQAAELLERVARFRLPDAA